MTIMTGAGDNPSTPNGAVGSASSTPQLLMLLKPMQIRGMARATRPKPTQSILKSRRLSTGSNRLPRTKTQAARMASSPNG